MNGLTLYRGKSAIDNTTNIIVIATGFKYATANPKTGDMIQVWILVEDEYPNDAINNGNDYAICGNCQHRKYNGQRTCYVTPMALGSIYRTYHKGGYVKFNYAKHADLFRVKKVRLSAYGDPVNIPYILMQSITKLSNGHTGYTHQWRDERFNAYKEYLQASCDNLKDFLDASDRGWSTFRVAARGTDKYSNEISCQGGKKTDCAKCVLCNGAGEVQRHIMIHAHGNNAHLVTD